MNVNKGKVYLTILLFILFIPFSKAYSLQKTIKYTQTQFSQSALSPQQVFEKLKEGNERFLSGKMQQRDYTKQVLITSKLGQAPYAVVLSCMDSRGPVEILLDQGIGDIFSLRIAGNIINQDIIGSMEYGTKIMGAKAIIIMGHTQCGAVAAACKSIHLGNLSSLLNKIKPSVVMIDKFTANCSAKNIDKIARQNVIHMMNELRTRSRIINQLIKDKSIILVGAMHDTSTGKIAFFEK